MSGRKQVIIAYNGNIFLVGNYLFKVNNKDTRTTSMSSCLMAIWKSWHWHCHNFIFILRIFIYFLFFDKIEYYVQHASILFFVLSYFKISACFKFTVLLFSAAEICMLKKDFNLRVRMICQYFLKQI